MVLVPPGGTVVVVASASQIGAGVTSGPPSTDVGQPPGDGDVGLGFGQTPATGPYSTLGFGQTPATGPGDGDGFGQTGSVGVVGCSFGFEGSLPEVWDVGHEGSVG